MADRVGAREPRTGSGEDRLRLTRPSQWMQPLPETAAWGALNTLITGILFFGFGGWLIGRWLSMPWIAAIGLLFGMACAVTVIWFRYGTGRVMAPQDDNVAAGQAPGRAADTKENR